MMVGKILRTVGGSTMTTDCLFEAASAKRIEKYDNLYSETCLQRTPCGPIFLAALDKCPL